jgi:DNA-binding NtrC family response regulator/tetratricopeptide (TPR) repeat protein
VDALSLTREFVRQGRFGDAAGSFARVSLARTDLETLLIKAQVLEMSGRLREAEDAANKALRSRLGTLSQRSRAEFLLSRVAAGFAQPQIELEFLYKSKSHAIKCGDVEQLGWTQLRLLAILCDTSDPVHCRSMTTDLRHWVQCAGSPALSTALHLVMADADGKRCLLAKSRRHLAMAKTLLQRYPNVWLEGWMENTSLAVSLVQCDLAAALDHGERALARGGESGVVVITRNALANLGRLHYMKGQFDTALSFYAKAMECTHENRDHVAAIQESTAQVYLAQGRLAESEQLLHCLVTKAPEEELVGGYLHRNSSLTNAELMVQMGRGHEAAKYFSEALVRSRSVGDSQLEEVVRLVAAESQQLNTEIEPAASEVNSTDMRGASADALALYERTLATRLLAAGRLLAARQHRDRALRIYRAIGNRIGEDNVWKVWRATNHADHSNEASNRVVTPSKLLHDLSAVLMHAGRPELVATQLIAILEGTPCVVGAQALTRDQDGNEEILGSCGIAVDTASTRVFAIGTARSRAIELHVQPEADLESHATVNAIGTIVAAVQELERARVEREERLTLWPIDELPAEDDDSVVTGRMREVMLNARKAAQSPVIVLITGESGTGKEVLARAIHRYSARSKKPFVPFNCTAVPRELLESQLFGYRRGAFTGADRDNPGLIRSAQEGTLFLDEVGELGLDLQPKLLRFLESGEIHPLGETTPISVNVRIVAATNADLQQLVADGRFREDLYYRLNVIQLQLPPLRERRDEIAALARYFALKASHDLGKGTIRVGEELLEHLVLYPWPGNIRQLSNEISRMVAMAEPDNELTPDHLSPALREETEQLKRRANGLELAVPLTDKLNRTVATLEREMIKVALRMNEGRVEAAAKSLGISRKGLYLKRQRLGL